MERLKLRYRRGPGQITVYEHELIHEDEQLIVTRAPFRPSASLLAQVPQLKAQEYRAIWLVAAGEWHDLGKVYDLDNRLIGYYCDIIRPLRRTADALEIDDLFLDLWVSPDGRWLVLDEDEFAEAIGQGWLEPSTAARARRELEELIAEVESGHFPPSVVERFAI